MLTKQKSPSFPRKWAFVNFGKLLIVFSTGVNLLYLLYSMTWRYCLLHLIKQNYKKLFKVFFTKNLFWNFRYLPFLCLFSVIDNFTYSGWNSSQEYPVNAEIPQGSILFLHFSYYTLMTFLIMSVILLSMWQQLELSCELASDIQDIVDWDRKWISHFNAK